MLACRKRRVVEVAKIFAMTGAGVFKEIGKRRIKNPAFKVEGIVKVFVEKIVDLIHRLFF